MKRYMIGLSALIALSAMGASAQDRRDFDHGGRGGGYERSESRGGYGPSGGGPPMGGPPMGGPRGYPQRGGYPQGGYRQGGYPGGYPGGFGQRSFGAPSARGGYPGEGYPVAPGVGRRGYTRGQFLPPGYGGGVVDPRQYHLRRPPNGYGWVTVGPNAYLTQRSTGLILDTAPLY